MNQLDVPIQGLKISYSDTRLRAPTLLFVHGNSCDKSVFKNQFDSSLKDHFRLIALDLPGHGGSDPATPISGWESPYSLPYYGRLLNAFTESIEADDCIYIGHSLGGHICIHSAKIKNPKGLLIFQTPPLETAQDLQNGFLPVPEMALFLQRTGSTDEMSALEKVLFPTQKISFDFRKSYLKTDPNSRENLVAWLTQQSELGEVSTLRSASFPICIVHGEGDPLINKSYLKGLRLANLWRQNILPIKSSFHFPQLEATSTFNQLLREFASEC